LLGALVVVTLMAPYSNTVNELCIQKYGDIGPNAYNYTMTVVDGYAVCDAKKPTVDVQCKLDGIGLKRCQE
jgi:hypothetical protein